MTELLDELLTEQISDRYADLDTASVAQLVAVMNDADATPPRALTGGRPCNADTRLSAAAGLPVGVVVGPEALTGSTRLKAGTAQKPVLNMISTIARIRLGETYGNLMVDLRVTNAKLHQQAVRIIRRATGPAAEAALDQAGLDVKTAILMPDAPDGADPRQRLAAGGARLRHALEAR